MNNLDTSLELRQLKLFSSLMQTLSITQTAEHMAVGQSAVSHSLNKLRQHLGDPLFVRSGRGIVATPFAQSIVTRVQAIIGLSEGLAEDLSFDPNSASGEVVIAANEYQRDLLLPALFRQMNQQAPSLRLRVVATPYAPLARIRSEEVDLVLTLSPPDNDDIHTKCLVADRQAIFYDPNSRAEPKSEADFLAADYIVPDIIVDKANGNIRSDFSPLRNSIIVPKLVLNTFSGLPVFLRDSTMLAPIPEKLGRKIMTGLAHCHAPDTYRSTSIHVCWHQRNHQSALHRWLIEHLEVIAAAL